MDDFSCKKSIDICPPTFQGLFHNSAAPLRIRAFLSWQLKFSDDSLLSAHSHPGFPLQEVLLFCTAQRGFQLAVESDLRLLWFCIQTPLCDQLMANLAAPLLNQREAKNKFDRDLTCLI